MKGHTEASGTLLSLQSSLGYCSKNVSTVVQRPLVQAHSMKQDDFWRSTDEVQDLLVIGHEMATLADQCRGVEGGSNTYPLNNGTAYSLMSKVTRRTSAVPDSSAVL